MRETEELEIISSESDTVADRELFAEPVKM